MKKYTFILALSTLFVLTSCGSGSTTAETTDSTATQVDTTVAPAVDSTADSAVAKPTTEEVK